MEKGTPHYRLADIQATVTEQGVRAFTAIALAGGRALGLTSDEMLAVIAVLNRRHFYKSMTTYADHTVWQDVYHAPTPGGHSAYIKFTLTAAYVVIQFKEK